MDLVGRNFGKYTLVEFLGQGGMAEVYKAHQPGLERYVAIKVMHRHLARTGDFVSRFRREARSIGQLQHSHIMHVIDFDVEGDTYYLVMDFIQGELLKDYLERAQVLSVDEAVALMLQLVDAIEYAHQLGMVHRDIKSANIMFRDETASHVILTDFGMARLKTDSGLTATGAVVGTPAYMSPEAIEGTKIDERADIYSLGVVLYEMVTGTTPYTGDTPLSVVVKQLSEPLPPPTDINPDLPPAVETLLLKTLEKDPDDRFQTASDLKAALSELQSRLNSSVPIPKSITPDAKSTLLTTGAETPDNGLHSQKRNFLALVTLGLITVLLVGFGFYAFFAAGTDRPIVATITPSNSSAEIGTQTSAAVPQIGTSNGEVTVTLTLENINPPEVKPTATTAVVVELRQLVPSTSWIMRPTRRVIL